MTPRFQFLFPRHPVGSLPPPTNSLGPICICFSAWEPPLDFPCSSAYTSAGEAFPRKLLELPRPSVWHLSRFFWLFSLRTPSWDSAAWISVSSITVHFKILLPVLSDFHCGRLKLLLSGRWHTCQLCSFLLLSYIKSAWCLFYLQFEDRKMVFEDSLPGSLWALLGRCDLSPPGSSLPPMCSGRWLTGAWNPILRNSFLWLKVWSLWKWDSPGEKGPF